MIWESAVVCVTPLGVFSCFLEIARATGPVSAAAQYREETLHAHSGDIKASAFRIVARACPGEGSGLLPGLPVPTVCCCKEQAPPTAGAANVPFLAYPKPRTLKQGPSDPLGGGPGVLCNCSKCIFSLCGYRRAVVLFCKPRHLPCVPCCGQMLTAAISFCLCEPETLGELCHHLLSHLAL